MARADFIIQSQKKMNKDKENIKSLISPISVSKRIIQSQKVSLELIDKIDKRNIESETKWSN